MVSTKELRGIFEDFRAEAGKRAMHSMRDAKMPDIGRRNGPPVTLIFFVGLTLGAAIGMLAAFLSAPYTGDEARRRLTERVDKMRKQGEERIEELHSGNGAGPTYSTPTAVGERAKP